jgi:hypothetical protein
MEEKPSAAKRKVTGPAQRYISFNTRYIFLFASKFAVAAKSAVGCPIHRVSAMCGFHLPKAGVKAKTND